MLQLYESRALRFKYFSITWHWTKDTWLTLLSWLCTRTLTWGPAAESTGNQVCTCHNLFAFAAAVGQFHLSLPPTCREVYSDPMKYDYSYQSRNQLIPHSLNSQPDFQTYLAWKGSVLTPTLTISILEDKNSSQASFLGKQNLQMKRILGQNPADYVAPLSHCHHQDPDTR